MIQILDSYWIIHARLAQSVERWTLNPTVVGSSPTLGDYFSFLTPLAKINKFRI